MGEGRTIGIWVPEHDDIVDRFDDQLGHYPSYSRSERIKDAMEMYMRIEQVLDEIEYDFDAEVSKRHWVRQALHDRARQEAELDG